jgi:hypothetical protein
MTPDELATKLLREFPEWDDDQAMSAAQSVYRASKAIEAELDDERMAQLSPLTLRERFLAARVIELEREVATKDQALTAVRSMLDAVYGPNDDHSRSAW